MKIRFWGTRGSIPAPLKPSEIAEKLFEVVHHLPADLDTGNADAVHNYIQNLPPLVRGTAGGNTPCVQIQSGNAIIAIGAGSGLREMGLELMKGPCGKGKGTIHILISHTHWDHLHGFTMFTPAFVPGNHIIFYGIHDLATAFDIQQQPMHWPVSLDYMQARKTFKRLEVGQSFTIGDLHINSLENNHPGKSYSFRLEDPYSTLVYASDVEFKQLDDQALAPYIEFFQDANAVIFDAQYTLREAWVKEDWGHSSAMIGIDLARRANVDTLILFHHDPTYSDKELQNMLDTAHAYQAQEPTLPPHEVLLAHEELTRNLARPGSMDVRVTADGAATIVTPISALGEQSIDALLALTTEDTHNAILNLSQIETLTTADLRAIIDLQHQHEALSLVTASSNLMEIIKLAGYDDYFAIYPTVQAALEAEKVRQELNLPGQILKGRYQIERTIGQGPLGLVLTAYDIHQNRQVALKALSPTFSPDTTQRFLQQAQKITQLSHPHILNVYAWDRDSDYVFTVEELMNTPTLQDMLNGGGPLDWEHERHLGLLRDIVTTLEYAHRQGIIHGDLKPANIYLTEQGIKISGFGLGRLEENHNLLTAPFLFLSSHYLTPEQILGHLLDARTDLYALGIIAYQLLTGQLPFTGSDQEILQAHLRRAPRPPRQLNEGLSAAEEHLILKLLAKNPNERYASAQQVRNVIDSLRTFGEDGHRVQRAPMIGRASAWQTLRERWELARRGHGQLVFITGEAGIGKTSLAHQVAAQSQPPVLLIGQCTAFTGDEKQSSSAYQLFTTILRTYFATVPPESFDTNSAHLLSNFARLVPEIQQMLPHLTLPPALEAIQEQMRMISSVTQFIQQATQRRPWLIILDNLQWADRNSLDLLRYLGHHLPQIALLIIGIYREEDVTRSHPLDDTLHYLNSHPGYSTITLHRLILSEVQQLLSMMWHAPVPQELAERIYTHTHGNPRYTEEVAQTLLDNGVVQPYQTLDTHQVLDQVELPQSVREAIKQRLSRLSLGTHQLLTQAAVLGTHFQFEPLHKMSGLDKWEALEHLDLALERRLIEEIPSDNSLRFHHNEIQHVLYAELGPLRRPLYHRQAGEALEAEIGAPHDNPLEEKPLPEGIAEQLAHHFGEAGVLDKALTYSFFAAQQAQRAYANEAARFWYYRTQQHYEQLPAEQQAAYANFYFTSQQALGEILLFLGRYDQALTHSTIAWKHYTTQAPQDAKNGQVLAQLCYQIAKIHERRSEYKLALNWVEKGLRHTHEEQPSKESANLYNLGGWINIRQGNYGTAQSQLQLALVIARVADQRQAEANILQYLGVVHTYMGYETQAQDNFEQACLIYDAIEDHYGESAVMSYLGRILAHQGHYARARTYFEHALDIYREIGDPQGEGAQINQLGILARNEGHYTQAVTYCEKAYQLYHAIDDPQGQSDALLNLGLVHRSQGEYDAAKSYFERAALIARGIGGRRGQGHAFHNLGVVASLTGNFAQAHTYYDQAFTIRQELGDAAGESETLAYLGDLAYQQGEYETAQQHCTQAQRIATQIYDRTKQAHALTLLGHTLIALKDPISAMTSYEQALNLYQALNQPELALLPLSGLGYAASSQGQHAIAYAHIRPMLTHLESPHTLYGTDDPLHVYWMCYQILQSLPSSLANKQSAEDAHKLITTAYSLLLVRAAKIKDEDTRRMYLDNIPLHRAILEESKGTS